jgi:peptidoglycan/LPS O-acetylase OafA/YrhL
VLTLLSSESDFKSVLGVARLAQVGIISYSLYLLHNPIQSLAVRFAVRFNLPEFAAALLLVSVPLLAAIVYCQTVEAWSLRQMKQVSALAK